MRTCARARRSSPTRSRKIRRGPRVGALIDGAYDERLAAALLEAMRQGREIDGPAGKVRFHATAAFAAIAELGDAAPARRRAEQRLDRLRRQGDPEGLPPAARRRAARRRGGALPDRGRRLSPHARPTSARSSSSTASRRRSRPPSPSCRTRATPGAPWSRRCSATSTSCRCAGRRAAEPEAEAFAFPLGIGALLGQRTAELHKALAVPTDDPAFAVEPLDAAHLQHGRRGRRGGRRA